MKGEIYRLSQLIGMDARDTAERDRGEVVDVRAVKVNSDLQGARLQGLILAAHHTGSLLGYDRGANGGPALVRWTVQQLHRHALFAPWDSVVALDWERGIVTVDDDRLGPLRDV